MTRTDIRRLIPITLVVLFGCAANDAGGSNLRSDGGQVAVGGVGGSTGGSVSSGGVAGTDLSGSGGSTGTSGSSGTSGTGGSAGTGGSSCTQGETLCADGCADLGSNANHCGDCARACTVRQLCVSGTCQCQSGLTACSGSCVDTQTDGANCGGCGSSCATGQVCTSGTCSLTCSGGQTPCGQSCVDTSSDEGHCGNCSTVCPNAQQCTNGSCQCASGLLLCGSACVDTSSDEGHCGNCSTVCPSAQQCTNGSCQCASGLVLCGSACVDTSSDEGHCGNCSTVCPSAQQCTNGSCQCASGLLLCGSACVDTSSDGANCGGCGVSCTGGRTCASGACACPSGRTYCGQSCTDTSTDGANCGSCGKACATGQSCSAGTCSGSLPPGVTSLFPSPGSKGQCADPPLRLGFSGAPSLGTSGKIQVFDAATSASVATVDMATSTISATIGGTTFTLQRPVVIDGNAVVVTLPPHALTYGKTYYVTVDSGAIRGPGGAAFSITGSTAWRFSTATAAPTTLTSLSVALDGTGQFCSVQGALDALPNNNSAASRITISPGNYFEIVHFRSKNNVTLHGQDRKTTVIQGTNNNNLNPSTSTRSLVGVDSASGIVFENLTIHNLTPQGGSQAEALRLQNCDKCEVKSADILSLQDTLLWSGRVYADNCFIAGNVDFVWGSGVAYFNNCEIKTVGRAGVNVQARNAVGAYGYVFVDSRLTSDSGITNNYLARVDASVYPGSHVAYINCTLGSHIAAAGWELTGGSGTSSLRFWEYQSKTPSGTLVDVSKRMAGSTQISASQAATMRDPTAVLGGWQPP